MTLESQLAAAAERDYTQHGASTEQPAKDAYRREAGSDWTVKADGARTSSKGSYIAQIKARLAASPVESLYAPADYELFTHVRGDLRYLLRLLDEHDLLTQIAAAATDFITANGSHSELADAVHDLMRARGELGTDPSELVDQHYEGAHDA